MDETGLRVGLLLAALAVAGVIVLMQRNRPQLPVRDLDAPQLDPGIYFFSAANCATCEGARAKLTSALGETGFDEYVWEKDPGIFTDLGVDAVPAVLFMKETGRGRLYPGRVEKALADR